MNHLIIVVGKRVRKAVEKQPDVVYPVHALDQKILNLMKKNQDEIDASNIIQGKRIRRQFKN